MSHVPDFVRLENDVVSVIFCCQRKSPALLYFGERLSDSSSSAMLSILSTRQEAKCAPAIEPSISLVPTLGVGFTGSPGLEVFGRDDQWSAGFTLTSVEQTDNSVIFTSSDEVRGLELRSFVTLDRETAIIRLSSQIINLGPTSLNVGFLNAATLALPHEIEKVKAFEGRWSMEFQTREHELFMGSYVRENRRGKTSHDSFPGCILYPEYTNELSGSCIGLHLAASANHKTRVEVMADGRRYAQFGELLFPGEIVLDRGESYRSPELYCGFGSEGFSSLSRQFHQFIRQSVLSFSTITKPRPVHYNTWEGIYFEHDQGTLLELAQSVSELGVERFVLDDGWFKGRRSDKAGLGDWIVDSERYPEGLGPLINFVREKGMEFGIWFEPEMVNPDSDLYRTHPEWVLKTRNNEQISFRNQLVLDLSNSDVTEYLFHSISSLLNAHPEIKYIKWDMNRDVNHPGNAIGNPSMHLQTKALYCLLERIKAEFPYLEIESCCSGGGRVDLGILRHTDRFWTSDSNDALDRLSIQRGFSYFFPPEIMGAHVGPRDCHITGRHISIELRAAVAMFGHFGIEMDPRELTTQERTVTRKAIKLYKEIRKLIHNGELYRLNDDGLSISFGFVTKNKNEAIFAYNSIKETPRTAPATYKFAGLDNTKLYTVELIWPTTITEYSTSILNYLEGVSFTGESLQKFGMQLPITFPQTALLFHVKNV